MHQMDALTEGGVENVFVLGHFHLEVDGLEVHTVDVAHEFTYTVGMYGGTGWLQHPVRKGTAANRYR
ncbi:hypothetical protein MSIM_49450 [Mycobacterium simiae]|nr:hypothetical protein MSIM_49450 [Mycobacterium simiae]